MTTLPSEWTRLTRSSAGYGMRGPSSGAKLNPSEPITALNLMRTRMTDLHAIADAHPGIDPAFADRTFAPTVTCGNIAVPAPMRVPAPITA